MRKTIMAKSALDQQIAELVSKSQHTTLAIWAADCAERALPYFEEKFPDDARPRQAIEACRTWARTRLFRMADVRGTSLAAHAAARDAAEGSPARSAARAAGQAIATAHVRTHSIAAAIYAATAVRDATDAGDARRATEQERQWQYQHLLELEKIHPNA